VADELPVGFVVEPGEEFSGTELDVDNEPEEAAGVAEPDDTDAGTVLSAWE
jgi:hypothetical protein